MINAIGCGIKWSHAGHTFTHRLMAAIHSGDRYPYSCVAMGMSVIPEDYHLLLGITTPSAAKGLSPLRKNYHLSLLHNTSFRPTCYVSNFATGVLNPLPLYSFYFLVLIDSTLRIYRNNKNNNNKLYYQIKSQTDKKATFN